VIGQDKKDEVLSKETDTILAQKDFKEADVQFLIAIENVDAAEKYILERADQIHGEFYEMLLSLVKAMEAEDRHHGCQHYLPGAA
jgi:hypothetical protein